MIRHSMRKLIWVMLMVCLLALAGCNGENCELKSNATKETDRKITYEGPLSCVTHYVGWGHVSLMDMTEEFHEKVLALLNEGTWFNDVTKCESDYEFKTKSEKIQYHSECGTFIDVTNQRSLQLSDEEQAALNKMLGVKK